MFNLHSIKSKLLVLLLSLIVAAFLFQFFYVAPELENSKINEIKTSQQAMADQLADELDSHFKDAVNELEAMAALPEIASLDRAKMDKMIGMLNLSNQFFNYYFVMDPQGAWLSFPTHPELVGTKIPEENLHWVNETFDSGKTVFLDVVKSNIGTLVSGFSTPIRNQGDDPMALLRGVFVVSEKNSLIRCIQNARIGESGYAYLVSANGQLIVHALKKLNYKDFSAYSMRNYEPVNNALNGQSGILQYDYEGKPWIAAYRPIRSTRWALIVQQPLEDVLIGAQQEAQLITFLISTFFSVGLLIAGIIVYLAIRPLSTLLADIKAGTIDASRNYPKNELGQLAYQYRQLYSDLYQSNERVKISENKFRSLFDYAGDAIFIVDFEGRFLEVNQAAVNRLEYNREDLLAMKVSDVDSADSAKLIASRLEKLQQGKSIIFEAVHLTRSGVAMPVEISARGIEYGNQKAILSIARDLTERKSAEEAIQKERENFKILVEESPFGIALIDASAKIKYLNSGFSKIFGYSKQDLPSIAHWIALAYPDLEYKNKIAADWEKEIKSAKSGRAFQRTVRCKDGSNKEIHFRTVPLASGDLLAILEDITEKKKLETAFINAQKMESLGTLAGGIAHDFNNLLTGILGNASLMMLDLDSSHGHCEPLKNIETYVQRGVKLTSQLLGLARGGMYEVRPTNINQLVQNSATLFGRTKKEISIHHKYQEDLWTVEVDRSQLEQVLLNLFINAWQAMPDGGALYLETKNTILDQERVAPYAARAGRYIKISVTDTGTGMDKATRMKVFDPFFTTKGVGRGTGLGLASAYGIIKNHRGFITVYSEPGKGSTFVIYLPASEKAAASEIIETGKLLTGNERILLVDDEEMIIDISKKLLNKLGYEVITANSGQQALKIYEKQGAGIDLVILDMIMPDMGGSETFDRLKAIDPDIKVLLASGYSVNGQARTIISRGCEGFLQKPFDVNELSQKLRQILE